MNETTVSKGQIEAVRYVMSNAFTIPPACLPEMETYFILVWQARYLRSVMGIDAERGFILNYDGKEFLVRNAWGFGQLALDCLPDTAQVAVSFREAWPEYGLPAIAMIKEWKN